MPDQKLTDAKIQDLLHTLTTSDPDFATFAQQHAILGEHHLPKDNAAELSCELIDVLRTLPEQAQRIDALVQAPIPERFEGGVVTVPVLLAATYLLRTHIRFKRRTDGKWEFQFEHKPADSVLLTQLIKKLAALLPGRMIDPVDK